MRIPEFYLKFPKSFLRHRHRESLDLEKWLNGSRRHFRSFFARGGGFEVPRRTALRFVALTPADRVDLEIGPGTRSPESASFLESALEALLVAARLVAIASVAVALLVVYAVSRFTDPDVFPDALLRAVEFLGPTFVKFGQWVATRRDLFPAEVCDTLARLQRHASTHSWMHTRKVLETTYGKNWRESFVRFDHEAPIGSGCCAQVYEAWIDPNARVTTAKEPRMSRYFQVVEFLKLAPAITFLGSAFGGSENGVAVAGRSEELHRVAVKVLHPGIEKRLERDLKIMRFLSEFATGVLPSLRWLSVTDCVEEFSRLMENQIDMELEAFNLLKFSKNFSGDDDVVFPSPYLELTHRGVLVESFHEGSPISEYLDRGDRDLRRKLAKIGVTAVLKMIFEDNFVHCDLHPGNILVQQAPPKGLSRFSPSIRRIIRSYLGDSPRLVILDCGLVASLNERSRKNLRDVFRSVARGEGELAGEYIMRHSVHMTPDPAGFKATMGRIVRTHLRESVKLANVNVSTVVAELFSAMVRYQVKQDGSFSSVILSMAVIEGLGRSLDPKIDIVDQVLPFVCNGYFGTPIRTRIQRLFDENSIERGH